MGASFLSNAVAIASGLNRCLVSVLPTRFQNVCNLRADMPSNNNKTMLPTNGHPACTGLKKFINILLDSEDTR